MRTLCLNVTYEPIGFLPQDRAVCLLLDDRIELIESDGTVFRSPGGVRIDGPSVVRLTRYIKIPRTLKEGITSKVLFARDHYTCQYCGTAEDDLRGRRNKLTIDHILPKSRGGPHHWENVVTACYHCNLRKRDRTPSEANMRFVHLYKDRSPKKPELRTFAWGGKLKPEQKKWVDAYYQTETNDEFEWSIDVVGEPRASVC